jgi:hypothetical protein
MLSLDLQGGNNQPIFLGASDLSPRMAISNETTASGDLDGLLDQRLIEI